MANTPTRKNDSSGTIGFEAKLWLTADKLHNSMDAAEYKHVVLGLIYAALTQPEVSDPLGQMVDGGAYPAVHPEIIGAMQIGQPNEPKILEAFHRTCAPLFEQAEANRTQSCTLASLRDTLLPKLLSGELGTTLPHP